MIFLKIILLIALFLILGKSADILVNAIKRISEVLKINTFVVGVILGILTTLPELLLGINAIQNGIESVSFGNLTGGIVIIFSLVLGVSLVMNKKINTDGDIKKILLDFIYIFLALIIGLKGSFNFIDGIIFILGYFLLIASSNNYQEIAENEVEIFEEKKKTFKEKIKDFRLRRKQLKIKDILIFIISLVILILVSNEIMNLAANILRDIKISEFVIGVVVFSIGTNLPELIVTIKASLNKNSELSINHLLGSAMANILILSILALLKGFTVTLNGAFFSVIIMAFITLVLVLIFYKTDKSFSRAEGIVLLIIYVLFICSQMYFSFI